MPHGKLRSVVVDGDARTRSHSLARTFSRRINNDLGDDKNRRTCIHMHIVVKMISVDENKTCGGGKARVKGNGLK